MIIAGVVMFGLGFQTDQRWLLFLSALFFGARVAAWLTSPGYVQEAAFCFDAPTRCTVGDSPVQTVHLHSRGLDWLPETIFTIRSNGFEPLSITFPPIPPDGRAEASLPRRALQRGIAEEHALSVEWTDWMGLRRSSVHAYALRTLIVHPGTVERAIPRSLSGVGDEVATRVDRSGSHSFAVREWRSGDPARHVHWRSTARRGQLVVVEHAITAGESWMVLIVGDGETRMTEPLVSAVASEAVAARASDRRVTLGGGQAGLAPLTGGTSSDILDWCARIDAPSLPRPALMGELFVGLGPDCHARIAVAGALPTGWLSQVSRLAEQHRVHWSLIDENPAQPSRRRLLP